MEAHETNSLTLSGCGCVVDADLVKDSLWTYRSRVVVVVVVVAVVVVVQFRRRCVGVLGSDEPLHR